MDSGAAAGKSNDKDNGEQDGGDATSSTPLCRWLPPMYREEMYNTMKLIGPLAIHRLLDFSIIFVISVFCGHIGKAELAGYALALAAINITTISVGFGLAKACDTFISQTFGSQNLKRVGVIVQRVTLILLLFCLVCWAVLLNFYNIMLLLKQEEEIVRIGNVFVVWYLPAIPAVLLRELQSSYLQNQGITLPQMFCAMATNVFNIISNYVLIYSFQLGSLGAAITNSLCAIVFCLLLYGCIRWKKLHRETWGGWSTECLQEWGSYMRLGIPSALVMCCDWWMFEIVAILAGMFGENILASQHVINEMSVITIMIPVAISMAACIRVGNALGAGDTERAIVSAKVILLFAGTVGVVQSIIIAAIRPYVTYIFTSDENVVETVSQILLIHVFAGLFEALEIASTGICLGAGLQAIVACTNIVCYYVISLSVGAALMFVAELSLLGLWLGICIGIFLESVFFLVLFYKMDWKKMSKKAQKRAGVTAEGAPEGGGADCPNTADRDGVGLPKAEGYTLVSTQELKGRDEDERSDADAGPPGGDAEQSNAGSGAKTPLSVPQLILRRGLTVLIVVFILVVGVALHIAFPVPEPTILSRANGTSSENGTLPLHR